MKFYLNKLPKIFILITFGILLQGCIQTVDKNTNLICKGFSSYKDTEDHSFSKAEEVVRKYTLVDREINWFFEDGIFKRTTEYLLKENDRVISEPRYEKDEISSKIRSFDVTEQEIHFTEFWDSDEYNNKDMHYPSVSKMTDVKFDRLTGDWKYFVHDTGSNSFTNKKVQYKYQAFGKCEQVEKKF